MKGNERYKNDISFTLRKARQLNVDRKAVVETFKANTKNLSSLADLTPYAFDFIYNPICFK